MITVRRGDLLGYVTAIRELVASNLPLPPLAGWKLGRILPDLVTHLRRYGKDRDALVAQYSGGANKIDQQHPQWAEFVGVLTAFDDETVELPYTLLLSDFGDAPVGAYIARLGSLVTLAEGTV